MQGLQLASMVLVSVSLGCLVVLTYKLAVVYRLLHLEEDDHRQMDSSFSQSWFDSVRSDVDNQIVAPSVIRRLNQEHEFRDSMLVEAQRTKYYPEKSSSADVATSVFAISLAALLAIAVWLSVSTAAVIFCLALVFIAWFDVKFMAISRLAVVVLAIAGLCMLKIDTIELLGFSVAAFAVLCGCLKIMQVLFKKITGKHLIGNGDVLLVSVLSVIFLISGYAMQFLVALTVLLIVQSVYQIVSKKRQMLVAFGPVLAIAAVSTVSMM